MKKTRLTFTNLVNLVFQVCLLVLDHPISQGFLVILVAQHFQHSQVVQVLLCFQVTHLGLYFQVYQPVLVGLYLLFVPDFLVYQENQVYPCHQEYLVGQHFQLNPGFQVALVVLVVHPVQLVLLGQCHLLEEIMVKVTKQHQVLYTVHYYDLDQILATVDIFLQCSVTLRRKPISWCICVASIFHQLHL